MFPTIDLTPSPIRILVQTLTHLVPSDNLIANGEPYADKLFSMLDRTCNHVWDYPFEPGLQRWYSYGDDFGYDNRVCFFLLDYGDAPEGKDEEVPIQCFVWDGEMFTPKPDLLKDEEVQAELKEVPFTPGPSDRGEIPPMRDIVRRRLRKAQFLSRRELDYMAMHPEDQEWLRRKVKPRFWTNFLEQMERRGRQEKKENEEEEWDDVERGEEEVRKGDEYNVEEKVHSGYV
ncbi:hypothetical protein AbraIFM66951_002255 [Aspergillus brasiliensis]|uniref:Uncharacterized protein n=1 Tax=Aspergillus brasiliensis TaxID=319629 RepID=A0A9W6DRJ1_9EURO|nr:hypothetical protein AbraCBS73388_002397 [Aspergillus brasiliensis]GKZ49684.1 hypothetical protein AbraIFM66951_002255 [Aspergillus brasiliensis]